MRRASILFKAQEAGILTHNDDGSFSFQYHEDWVNHMSKPDISLRLPKRIEPYRSKFLFPFFFNMLPEGSNKQAVCKDYHIDKDDFFSILLITAKYDTIGAVTVIKIQE